MMVPYHANWGKHGDIGVAASVGGSFAGAAFARLFTQEAHGDGFVDEETPELAVAVEPSFRGGGVGRTLMNALADTARDLRIPRLSLSVNNPNPAKGLYESLGYQLLEDDGGSARMVLHL